MLSRDIGDVALVTSREEPYQRACEYHWLATLSEDTKNHGHTGSSSLQTKLVCLVARRTKPWEIQGIYRIMSSSSNRPVDASYELDAPVSNPPMALSDTITDTSIDLISPP